MSVMSVMRASFHLFPFYIRKMGGAVFKPFINRLTFDVEKQLKTAMEIMKLNMQGESTENSDAADDFATKMKETEAALKVESEKALDKAFSDFDKVIFHGNFDF